MSYDRGQRPWSSGYTNHPRYRQSQNSEQYQDQRNQSYRPYSTDRYVPTPNYGGYIPKAVKEQQRLDYNQARRGDSRNRHSQWIAPPNQRTHSSEDSFGYSNRSYNSHSGRSSSNRPYQQPYGSRYSNNEPPSYSKRYEEDDFYGNRRQSEGFNNKSRYNQYNRSAGQSNAQDEDFYESRHSTSESMDHSKKVTSNESESRFTGSENRFTGKGGQSRPSLIPKDFNDDDEDDEDEEEDLEREIMSSSKQRKVEPKNESISERIPLSVEHKEELDLESSGESREPTAEISASPANKDSGNRNRLLKETIDSDESEQSDQEETHQLKEAGLTSNGLDKLYVADELKRQQLIIEDEGKTLLEDKSAIRERSPSEESDIYDPAAEVEKELREKEEQEAHDLKEEETEPFENGTGVIEAAEKKAAVEVKHEAPKVIVPLEKIESAIFPLRKIEFTAWEFNNYPRDEVSSSLPYLLKKPIKDFNDYPFYDRNFLVHEQVMKPKLQESLTALKENTLVHKRDLLNEYSHRLDDWNGRLSRMSSHLRSLYGTEDEEHDDSGNTSMDIDPDKSRSSTSRRGRYHGDTVRSEAEFLEILKNLEKEKEEDPLYRAEQLAAKIPDMILNPINKSLKFINVNNLVLDKKQWCERIRTDPIDNFTRREHELFCEAFLAHPKKFGRISLDMGGLRTAEECVLHYYKTKKSLTDYKQLLALKKKKARKGPKGRRGPKPKTGASTPNTPATETAGESGDELSLENFIPKEANEEVFYTETGRRRRAAAPTFEPKEKKDEIPGEDRKRSLEDSSAIDNSEELTRDQPSKVKKQRGPKPKKQLENIETQREPEVENGILGDGRSKSLITSYWSVKDITLFTGLLQKYGAKWNIIADELKTKSPIMVRNYYHRNADRHGWSDIVGNSEAKDSLNDHLQADQSQVQGPHKNPPLGFFTAQTNVPSNVSFSANPASSSEQSSLPRLGNMVSPSYAQTSSDIPTAAPVPILPQLSTFVNNRDVPQAAPATQAAPVPRSNPFSITNLLNPSSDENKQSAPVLPIAGTFERDGQRRELYSSYTNPTTTSSQPNGSSNAFGNLLNDAGDKPSFNPLNTLVAAAEDKKNGPTWNEPKVPTHRQSASFDAIRTLYGRDTPSYAGGYQAPYSESSERSRSILNDSDSPGLGQKNLEQPRPIIDPPVSSSSLRNILSNDQGSSGEQRKSL